MGRRGRAHAISFALFYHVVVTMMSRRVLWGDASCRCMYVCGSAKQMPKDVQSVVLQVIAAGITSGDAASKAASAQRLLAKMKKERRYIVEAWA